MGELSAIGLFLKGGPVMWPILLCSVVGLSIVIERYRYFRAISKDSEGFQNDVFELLKQDRIREAIERCAGQPSPVAKILQAGILKSGSSRPEIKEAITEVSEIEIPKMEKGLAALSTIAHGSTLLGLLGTMTGLCGTFYAIEQRARTLTPVTPADIAGGVWEALLCAVAGLLVAIPVFFVCQYLLARVNSIVSEMEQAGTEVTNLLVQLSESQNPRDQEELLRQDVS